MSNTTPSDFVELADSQRTRSDIRQMMRVARKRADSFKNLDLTDPDSLKVRKGDHPSLAIFKRLWRAYEVEEDPKVKQEYLKMLSAHDGRVNAAIDKHLTGLISASVQAHKLGLKGDEEGNATPDQLIKELIDEGMSREEAECLVYAKEADADGEG